jgi:hypothetical protein
MDKKIQAIEVVFNTDTVFTTDRYNTHHVGHEDLSYSIEGDNLRILSSEHTIAYYPREHWEHIYIAYE